MMCSLAFAGAATVDWANDRHDKEGLRFGDELERIGYAGAAAVGGRKLDSYFELHIEQGPKLDAAGIKIGVVTGGFPTRGMRIEITGETAHVGPTADGAAAQRAGRARATSPLRSTISAGAMPMPRRKTTAARLDLWPNLPGIISERATLFCDLRHPDPKELDKMVAEIETALPDCARRGRCDVAIGEQWGFGVMAFDAGLIGADPAGGGGARPCHHGYQVGGRPRQLQHSHHLPVGDDLHAVQGRHQPQRGRGHDAGSDTMPGANVLLHAVLARANR